MAPVVVVLPNTESTIVIPSESSAFGVKCLIYIVVKNRPNRILNLLFTINKNILANVGSM